MRRQQAVEGQTVSQGAEVRVDTAGTTAVAIHARADATFTDFGGWEMPVEFESISLEHAAVRESVGIFDVSHMSEIEGPARTRRADATPDDERRDGPRTG